MCPWEGFLFKYAWTFYPFFFLFYVKVYKEWRALLRRCNTNLFTSGFISSFFCHNLSKTFFFLLMVPGTLDVRDQVIFIFLLHWKIRPGFSSHLVQSCIRPSILPRLSPSYGIFKWRRSWKKVEFDDVLSPWLPTLENLSSQIKNVPKFLIFIKYYKNV